MHKLKGKSRQSLELHTVVMEAKTEGILLLKFTHHPTFLQLLERLSVFLCLLRNYTVQPLCLPGLPCFHRWGIKLRVKQCQTFKHTCPICHQTGPFTPSFGEEQYSWQLSDDLSFWNFCEWKCLILPATRNPASCTNPFSIVTAWKQPKISAA